MPSSIFLLRITPSKASALPVNAVELYDHQLLNIIHVGNDRKISFIAIDESSICEAFESFFRSLNASEYYCGTETQEQMISKVIRLLKENIRNSFFPPHTHTVNNKNAA